MSGILFLNADDFVMKKAEKGNLLCLNYDIQGLSLVLFYSNECQHCNKLMVKYKQLPFNINGCQFTMININKPDNRRIVQSSNHTIVPITYVPDILLYVDGVPYMRYDGPHEIHSIKAFILDVYQQLQKTAFMEGSTNQQQSVQRQGEQHRQTQSSSSTSQSRPSASLPNAQNGGRPPRPSPPQRGGSNQANAPGQVNSSPQDLSTKTNSIPAYTIGRPKCSGERDDVCYLSFNQAYHGGNETAPSTTNGGGVQQSGQQPVFYNSPPGIMQQ